MKFHIRHPWLLACHALWLPFSTQAQVEITSYDQTGVLEWSNALPHAQSFDVEWSGALTGGVWQSSWTNLAGIPATASTCRVEVPAFYRVVAHTNVLRSQWTILYYLIADNDLEPDFIPKFCELGRWNSDTNVQQVVQFARNGRDARYGNWIGCERFYVTNGLVPTQDNAVPDWGDGQGGRLVNMAAPATLSDFLAWGMANYPADHYALLIGDHGFGWTGLGICWSFAKSILYIPELRAALETAPAPVDCLFLDACHMNMADTIAEVRQTGLQTILASETYGQVNWPYGGMIEGLQSNPSWTPRQFAADVNERLWTYYSVSNPVADITLCTTDLALAPELVSNTALFVSGVLDTNVPLAEVQDRARAVMDAITHVQMVRHLGPDWDGIADGISVYFPMKDHMHVPQSFGEYTAKRSGFANEAGWRSLLEAYYDPMEHPPFYSQLYMVRAAITNYLDPGGEHIDLYDFCRRFAEAPP